jgi:hypothetical protein
MLELDVVSEKTCLGDRNKIGARIPRLAGSAEPEHDSGAKPKIILTIIDTVGEFRHEVFSLHGPNRDVLRYSDVQAAASRHREGVSSPRVPNSGGRCDASEKDLSEGCDFAAQEIDSRAEHIRKRASKERSLCNRVSVQISNCA